MSALLLLLAPFFLWMLAAPRWHMLLAALYSAVALLVGGIWLRHLLRDLRDAGAQPAAQADWRWKPAATPEQFRHQFEMFLRLQGWRVRSSQVGMRERVEITARKDRWCIALLCVGPRQAFGDSDDLRRLATVRDDIGATHAALVSDAATGPATVDRLADPHILRLRFADLARLETAMGLSV
jgi:hypothetical protein